MSGPQVRLEWDIGCQLGEGPAWFDDEAALRFVDIKGGRLHRYDPVRGTRETVEVSERPGFIVRDAKGGMIVGAGDSLYPFDGQRLGEPLLRLRQPQSNRINDGAVDAQGRLWFGTMDDDEQAASGVLHCLAEGELHQLGCAAVVTNGPAISADGQTLYHVDTLRRTVWRFGVRDPLQLVDGTPFLTFAEEEGYPDGVILDAEGCLWVALWDGWCVRRYTPAGRLIAEVRLPCARVTKVALGGPDGTTAYVTTARTGLDAAQLAEQPWAGGLFAFDAPAPAA